MHILIGILIGFAIWHYWPEQAANISNDAKAVIHKGAEAVSEATAPKSSFEKFRDSLPVSKD